MTIAQNTNVLLNDLTEALGTVCPMVCVAVIVQDDNAPRHVMGCPEAAKLLSTFASVQAALVDGVRRVDEPPSGTAVSGAGFIAVEPLNVPYLESATVIALAGKDRHECERAVALAKTLATATTGELILCSHMPYLASALAEAECGITIADPNLPDTPLIYANDAFTRITGYSKAELVGRNSRFLQSHLRDQPGAQKMRNALERGVGCTTILTNIRRDGTPFENKVKLRPMHDDDGRLSHIIGIQLDVTAEYSALESLELQKRRYNGLIEADKSYIWHMNAAGEILEVSDGWLALAGLKASGQPPNLAAIRGALTENAAEEFRLGWAEALVNGTPFEVIYQLPARSQSFRWFLDRIIPVLDDEGALLEWVAVSRDITELNDARQDTERAVHEDGLTGLLSRFGFARRLDERLAEGDLHPASLVVVVDIKALSEINNAHGYEVGDEVLREVARRLTASVREHGLVARTDGDKFIVLATLDNGHTPRQWRQQLTAVFDAPFGISSFALFVQASFGYTRIHTSAGNAQKLINDATLVLHQSQNDPTRSWTQYTQALERRTRETVAMTTALRHAIDDDELALYYQPKVDLASGRIVSAEALLRWNHPKEGLIPPDRFIPLAEKSQLIGRIGDWVLRQACRDIRAWRDAGGTPTPISVNLSLIQFQLGNVPETVRQALADYDIAPELLTLEITESVFKQHCPALKQDMQALSAIGVRLSLDDFGTGYSSLGHLNDYFFDEIKIDKSFVWQLHESSYGRAIVEAVILIAAAIDADVVAEGIESAAHVMTLQRLGCTNGQGFYYSRPVSEPSWRQLLIDQKAL